MHKAGVKEIKGRCILKSSDEFNYCKFTRGEADGEDQNSA